MTDQNWKIRSTLPALVVATLLPLTAMAPAFRGGLIVAADTQLHLHRIYAMATLIADGQLYPRWVPWFYLGYGYPVFNFYPPVSTYLGGLLVLLGLTPQVAFILLLAASWMLGSLGMFLLARLFFRVEGAFIAALLWSYAPARLNEIWQQGSLPQALAVALVPWGLWALVRTLRKPSTPNMLVLAVIYSLLLLTHQPTTLLATIFFVPFSLIYWLYIGHSEGRVHLINATGRIIGAGTLTVGLCAFYLIPLAVEVQHVQIDDLAADVLGIVQANFYTLNDLFTQPPAPDLTDLSRGIPISYGLLTGVLGAIGVAALLLNRRWWLAGALCMTLLLGIFLMTRESFFIWRDAPFMAELRYPRRVIYTHVTFFALAGGAITLLFPAGWRRTLTAITALIILIATLPILNPNFQKIDPTHPIDAADALIYEREVGALGTVSYNEFTPNYGRNIPTDLPTNLPTYAEHPQRLYLTEPDDLTISRLDDAHWEITAMTPTTLTVRQFYFPGWHASINGEPIPIMPDPQHGQITISLPAGTHMVDLRYTSTRAQQIGTAITGATLLIMLGLAIVYWRQHAQSGH